MNIQRLPEHSLQSEMQLLSVAHFLATISANPRKSFTMYNHRESEPILPSNDLYQHALSLNNRGAREIVARDKKNASKTLASALHALKEAATHNEYVALAAGQEVSSRPRLQRIVYTFVTPGQGRPDGPSPSRIITDVTLFPSGGDFVYEQPIQIHHTPCVMPDSGLVDEHQVLHILTFCIVYNLALCSHLTGVDMMCRQELQEMEGNAQTMLERAVRLYEYAQTLSRSCSSQYDYCALHTLAILNNLGQVFYKLGYHAQANLNFELLLHAILGIRLALDSHCDEKQLMIALDGFLSNIPLFCVASFMIAPAA